MFRNICIISVIVLSGCCATAGNAHDSRLSSHATNHDVAHAGLTDEQILSLLEKQAPKGMFPKHTKLTFLGTVRGEHVTYHVVFTSLVWGQAQRETARLVIFSINWKYLGNYGEIYTPPSIIRNGVLYWPYPAELGNKISLAGRNPPKKVVLNGEIYHFDTEMQ